MPLSLAGIVVLALGVILSSCSSTSNNCRSLGLDPGYHTVPLHLSWSGVPTDNPNFTKLDCDVPLAGAILSHDTLEKLQAMKDAGGLVEGRSSFGSKASVFLYNTGTGSESKTFILRLELESAKPST